MEVLPDEGAFGATYTNGKPQLVWTTLVADLETPVSAYLKLARERFPSFLFESVEGGAVRGRYSIIGFDPDLIFRVQADKAEINRAARTNANAFEPAKQPPLQALRALIEESKVEVPFGLPPMAAGIFGYLGYDMVRQMEKLAAPKSDPIGTPDAVLVRPTIWSTRQGIHPRRRHLPGRAVAALSAPFTLPPFALYRALRRVNPSPFCSSSTSAASRDRWLSPEILVRLRDGKVTIRPIAGTRRAARRREEDKANARAELLADPKERAEHLMLLDLGRNDVGRVAERSARSRSPISSSIERYSHVMHIVSNVEGEIDPEKHDDAIDALVAGFPAGTVSGAPKVRAMEIIDELEKEKRGVYGGCVGYFAADGSMDTCIVLRTAVVKDGTMYVQAGAGIVADSPSTTDDVRRSDAPRRWAAPDGAARARRNRRRRSPARSPRCAKCCEDDARGRPRRRDRYRRHRRRWLGQVNISTCASFIVAGAGVPVAKHGNRALSSKSGAADVLAALGVNIEHHARRHDRALHREAGIGFMFAPTHHPAMKHVGPTRVELATRTIFNLLGPLSNPAGVKRQMVGVFARTGCEPLAGAEEPRREESLGRPRLRWPRRDHRLTGPTHVAELENGNIRTFDVTPEDAGLPRASREELKGGDARANAEALRDVLDGKPGAYRDVALFNAAAGACRRRQGERSQGRRRARGQGARQRRGDGAA
jgi:anthranilate phosphoribosyltransferase